jgi:hypothetical protein
VFSVLELFVMPSEQILTLLLSERDKLNRAIEALQGTAKRRGRPPKNAAAALTAAVEAPAPAKARRKRTTAQKKAQAERMKAYWAAKKKTAKN